MFYSKCIVSRTDTLSYKLSSSPKLILTSRRLGRHGGLSADNYLEEMNKNMKCVWKRWHQSGRWGVGGGASLHVSSPSYTANMEHLEFD